jgi:hypothetical protein
VRADIDPADLARYEATSVLDIDAKSGHTSVVTFTPTKAATFEFHSDEGDEGDDRHDHLACRERYHHLTVSWSLELVRRLTDASRQPLSWRPCRHRRRQVAHDHRYGD